MIVVLMLYMRKGKYSGLLPFSTVRVILSELRYPHFIVSRQVPEAAEQYHVTVESSSTDISSLLSAYRRRGDDGHARLPYVHTVNCLIAWVIFRALLVKMLITNLYTYVF